MVDVATDVGRRYVVVVVRVVGVVVGGVVMCPVADCSVGRCCFCD